MADEWLNDDPFDSIVREFFGERPRRARRESPSKGEDDERTTDFIETDDKIYLIFELPGYSTEDVKVQVSDRTILIQAKKVETENVKDYLSQKLSAGIRHRLSIPDEADTKKYSYNISNGILEVSFEKK
jgi:HSP20 family molecular chaperone IbpA